MYDLAKINENIPLPQPKSKTDCGVLLFCVINCSKSFKYVSEVGSHTGPCGYILFLPSNGTWIPFFLYSYKVFYWIS